MYLLQIIFVINFMLCLHRFAPQIKSFQMLVSYICNKSNCILFSTFVINGFKVIIPLADE